MRTWEYPEPGRDRLNARHTGSTSGRIPVRNPRTCSVHAKSDATISDWLPPNPIFVCRYIEIYLSVMAKYHLPITRADRDTASRRCLPAG